MVGPWGFGAGRIGAREGGNVDNRRTDGNLYAIM